MTSTVLSSILIKDIIAKLSKDLKTKFAEHFGEYRLEIPRKMGKGLIFGINFPNGVGLLQLDMVLKDELELEFKCKQVQPLYMLFCVEGNCLHQFSDDEDSHEFSKYQSAMLGSQRNSGHKFLFPAGQKNCIKILHIDRERFATQLTFSMKNMEDIYREILGDTDAIRTIYHYTQYSMKMSQIMGEIDSFTQVGLQRVTFMGAKALELFSYMLMLYMDDLRESDQQNIPRRDEIEKIREIITTIDIELENLPTIEELAKRVGISEAKLQDGFKIIFDQTVNEYIQSKRLERAMLLIQTTHKTISEVVYAIGFNSRSYFSKLFKERYGIPPSEIRAKRKEEEQERELELEPGEE